MVTDNKQERKRSVFSDLDGKQRRAGVLTTAAVALLFVITAFTFMNFLYCLADCIGSLVSGSPDIAVRDALRSLPIFFTFFITLAGLMTAHTFFRNTSEEILRRKAKKHAVIGIALSAAVIVYVIAGVITGRYLSIVEGAPSRLFPLDAALYALLFILLGICVLAYFKKSAETGKAFGGPCRAPIREKGGGVRVVFRTFWLLIGLYGFCGFFYSLFIIDFRNGYVPYVIAVMLASLAAFLTIAVWELVYNNLTAEKRSRITLPLALFSLTASVGTAVFYFLALKNNLDGPANVGFGILPVAFSASVNFATLLVVATPIIVSVSALIKGVFRRIKNKKLQ